MQDQERIKTLYAVITGHHFEEGKPTITLKSDDLWRSASLLSRRCKLTDTQLGLLLLLKFGDVQEDLLKFDTEEMQPERVQGVKSKAESTDALILEAGIIPWSVEVDGLPVKWLLNYNQTHLPAKRGDCISFQGKQYRISKIYGTALSLTSLESDTIYMNQREVIS